MSTIGRGLRRGASPAAWSLLALALLCPSAALAHPQITLSWSAPVPPFSFCPDGALLRRHLAARAPREVLRRRVYAELRMSRLGARFHLRIRIRRRSSWVVSQHEGTDCEPLAALALNEVLREAAAVIRPGTRVRPDLPSEGGASSDDLPVCAPDLSPVPTRLCDRRERFDPGEDFSLALAVGVLVPRAQGASRFRPEAVLRVAWSPWFTQSAFLSIALHVGTTFGGEVGGGFRLSGARALDVGRRWIFAAAVGTNCTYREDSTECGRGIYVRAAVRHEWSFNDKPLWVAFGPTVGMRGVGLEVSVGFGHRVTP
jgi:hypothetical protein